jgi:hypothetical protein
MIARMGRDPLEQATPDLFSGNEVRVASAAAPPKLSVAKAATDGKSQRYVLPKNLRNAVKHLPTASWI